MLWLKGGHWEALLGSLKRGVSNPLSVFNHQIDGEEQCVGQH